MNDELKVTMAEVLEAGDVGCAVLSLPKCEMLVIYNHGGTENTRRKEATGHGGGCSSIVGLPDYLILS